MNIWGRRRRKNIKVLKKLFVILAISLLLVTVFQNNIFAYNWMAEVNNQAGGEAAAEGAGAVNAVTSIAGAALTIARLVCVGVAIVMLVVLAIKYMSSAPGDRATIKKHAVVYVVGALVMFASSGILGIIQQFSGAIKPSN